jgi:hypothetical protein
MRTGKTLFFIVFFIVLTAAYSCRKNDLNDGENEGKGYTWTTESTPVTARLVVYETGNDQASNPLQILCYDASPEYRMGYGGFFSDGPLTMDRFLSGFRCRTTLTVKYRGFDVYKTFTALSGNTNYAEFKFIDPDYIGSAYNFGSGVTLALPREASLTVPPRAFGSADANTSYSMYAAYWHPSTKDYIVSLPHQPLVDADNKRWFLESYGVLLILPVASDNTWTDAEFGGKEEALLRLPIPADRLATAPDSVAAWHLEPGYRWLQRGVARKVNGFYEKRINLKGFWNFARPKDAVYLTLRVRTQDTIPVVNTRYVIKSYGDEVAAGRTDAEGNALALVPSGRPLTVDLENDHFSHWLNVQTNNVEIGSLQRASEKTVSLPDRTDISIVEGLVYTCDGKPFGNGSVEIAQPNAKDDYTVPIVNGKFTTAQWIAAGYAGARLTFLDAAGNRAFAVDSYLASPSKAHLKRLHVKYFACPDTAQLYGNFRIDSDRYVMSGTANSSGIALVAKTGPGGTDISLRNGNKGCTFSVWFGGGPSAVINQESPLIINNEVCTYDPNGISEMTVYRNDAVLTGIIEGWFAIDYLDPQNTSHTASGNFRVKIIN